ncbi:autotransporter domain-containing protein [Asticcacaulis sp.]|uniref:autotransporter domain-containing protein n=1 Tax=Asticcacaulis sp. TaxID=1872648 RepID=UPI003F7BF48B
MRKNCNLSKHILLTGTAMSALLAGPLAAAPVVIHSTSDVTVNQSAASGTPVAADIQAGTASIDATIDDVTATATSSDTGSVVTTTTSGAGTVKVQIGTVTVTGQGNLIGVRATSGNGDIDIQVDSLDMAGTGTAGILATSTNGNVHIHTRDAVVRGLDFDPLGAADAVAGISTNGAVVIEGGHLEAYGQYGSGAVALGGTTAEVTVDEAISHGEQAATLYVSGLTGAKLNAGTVTATGNNAAAINVFSDQGDVTVTAGSVQAGPGGYASLVRGQGDISVTLGNSQSDRFGLNATSIGNGKVDVTLNGDLVSHQETGITASGGAVTVTLGEEASIASGGSGITVTATGAVDIGNDGAVAASGNLGNGIKVTTPGAVNIVSNAVGVTGAGADTGAGSDGLRIAQGGIIVEGGNGAIQVTSTDVSVEGEYRYGISASGNGAITVDSGNVTLASKDSAAIAARGGAGDVTVSSGHVVTTGDSGAGIVATATSGNITITADQTEVKGTGQIGPFTGDAITGTSQDGNVTITSQNASSDALYGTAIGASAGGNVSITSGTAQTTGDGGLAIYAIAAGNTQVSSGTLTTTGDNSIGISARANSGDVSVASENLNATGDHATGVWAKAAEDVNITSGNISATGEAIHAESNNGVNTIEVNGTVAGTSATSATILTVGTTHLVNAGAISAANGQAVRMGDSDDSFTMMTGSTVSGVADLGAGEDTVHAQGEGSGDSTGEVAAFSNAEHLSIDSGQWSAAKAPSTFDDVAIAAGAVLTVAQHGGDLAIQTASVQLDGKLAFDLDTDTEAGDLANLSITGAGQVYLQGPATVLFDDVAGLQHTGGTFVEKGRLLLTSTYGGNIQTDGTGVFQIGNGTATGHFTGDLVNNGTFIFDRPDDYTFSGGFSGTGLLEKDGAGTLIFAGLYDFTGVTQVNAGTIALTGALADTTQLDLGGGTIDLSQNTSGQQTIAALSGDSGTLNLGSTDLTVNQSSNSVFSGSLSGDGTLTKDGDGDLKLNGDGSNYTGDLLINGGILSVNGTFSGTGVTVNEDAKLGGNGTVGDTIVDGGTIGAGNSIGHLRINGDLILNSSSALEVEVDNAGHADLVDVTGVATLGDASVNILAAAGRYKGKTDYTILTAAGGINGHFGSVTSNFAFLTPTLAYSTNAVSLTLTRNDVAFADLGQTANEKAVGNLLQAQGPGNALFEETLLLADTEVSPDFASLTGEAWATLSSATIETSQMLRAQTDIAPGTEGGSWLWGTVLGSSGKARRDGATQGLDFDHSGLAAGFGWKQGGLDYSVGAGTLTTRGRDAARIKGDTVFVTGRIRWTSQNGWALQAGAQYGQVNDTLTREATLGALGGTVSGKAKGDMSQIWAELGRSYQIEGAIVTPFAGMSRVSADFDKASETGAATALNVDPGKQDVRFGELGVRLEGDPATGPIQPRFKLSWRHALNNRTPLMMAGFDGSPETMSIKGIAIASDAAAISAGLRLVRRNFIWDVNYNGSVSDTFTDHSAKASLMIRF